jgi:multicomponent Na+:H+ antiporter subunit D
VLIALPILIPLLTALLSALFSHRLRVQRVIAVIGSLAVLATAVVQFEHVATTGRVTLYIGGWPAPLGITLVADALSALFVLVAATLHFCVTVYALRGVDRSRQRYGYFPFANVLMMGVCGAFLTGDLFNLYVWFEVMLIASFVLMVLGGTRAEMEAGIKYVTLSLLSSAFFLAAVGIIYGVAHTLNLADLAGRIALVQEARPWLVTASATLLLVSFGIKAAVFPLYFWLPASYHTPPPAVSALFAGLLTKVGVYALLRVFTTVFPNDQYVLTLLLYIAGLTMFIGVLGAVAQKHVRRILSVHIISQIGYMVMGLALLASATGAARQIAIAAAVFYIIHNMIVKTNLFLISGIMRDYAGDEKLENIGGLALRTPWLAGLFLVSALALAGLPPLSGFWAKVGIIRAGFLAEQYLLAGVALLVGLFTLISMLKIWNEAFWKPQPEQVAAPAQRNASGRSRLALVLPAVLLALLTVGIGLYPQPLFDVSRMAAEQLLDRQGYTEAVDVVLPLPERVPIDVEAEP